MCICCNLVLLCQSSRVWNTPTHNSTKHPPKTHTHTHTHTQSSYPPMMLEHIFIPQYTHRTWFDFPNVGFFWLPPCSATECYSDNRPVLLPCEQAIPNESYFVITSFFPQLSFLFFLCQRVSLIFIYCSCQFSLCPHFSVLALSVSGLLLLLLCGSLSLSLSVYPLYLLFMCGWPCTSTTRTEAKGVWSGAQIWSLRFIWCLEPFKRNFLIPHFGSYGFSQWQECWSSPYFQTAVKKKTLEPQWLPQQATAVFPKKNMEQDSLLRFEVWDYDQLTKDDSL